MRDIVRIVTKYDGALPSCIHVSMFKNLVATSLKEGATLSDATIELGHEDYYLHNIVHGLEGVRFGYYRREINA